MNRANPLAVNCFQLCVIAGLLHFQCLDGYSQSPADKQPVPSAARQSEIKKLLEETYELKKADSPAKKEKVAQTLMAAGKRADLSADEKYVVLTTVIQLSKEAGGFESCMEAVGLLGTTFEGDPRQLKEKYLIEFLQDCKNTESLKSANVEAISAARADALQNRYPEARALLAAAESANRRVPASAQAKLTITEGRNQIANRETQWKAFQKANATLLKTPDEPEANLQAGRWLAVFENNWKDGLPFLAKGNNSQWKAASELELKTSYENAAQIAVADGWWDLAQNEKGDAKSTLLKHSGEWYARALGGSTSLQKLRIEKRLNEIGGIGGGTGGTGPGFNAVGPGKPDPTKTGQVAGGPAVPFRHPNDGRSYWKQSNGTKSEFRLVKTGEWIETATDGKRNRYSWKEVARTPEYIELFDKDRKFSMRLSAKRGDVAYNSAELKPGGFSGWGDGGWNIDPPDVVYLSNLPETSHKVLQSPDNADFGWGKNGEMTDFDPDVIMLDGRPSPNGIFTQPPPDDSATVKYDIGRLRKLIFRARFGVADQSRENPKGKLTFVVIGDGEKLFTSKPVQNWGVGNDCEISIRNVKELELRVECEGDSTKGLAVWFEPRLSLR